MSGERILVDTSAPVDFVKGVDAVATAMAGQEVQISIITEIEFLSWPGLSEERIPEARAFLNEYTSNGVGDFVRDYSA